MTYEYWINQHQIKHKNIINRLAKLSDHEVIEYFDFENMVKNEPNFCPLYKENTKCHDIEKLNCYFCACPFFRLETNRSFCVIDSKFGGSFKSPDGFSHQDCSKCDIPHKEKYIKDNFTREWGEAMRFVK
jgi:Zn-finger protein